MCRHIGQIDNRAKVGKQLELLSELDVDAGKAAADRGRERPFERDAGALNRVEQALGDVLVVLLIGVGAGCERFPFELDSGRLQDANGSAGHFRSNAIAGNQSDFVSHGCAPLTRAGGLPLTCGASCLPSLCLEQVLQLGHEFLDVFEIEINRGEAHVRHLVEAAQAKHDEFADLAGLAFAFGGVDRQSFRLR